MYDVIIVGGGSAGCVLANRLSSDEQSRVLLLEAGPDYDSERAIPEDIRDSSYAPQTHDWGYEAEPDELGNVVAVPRGKIIGGSSSINYCFAMRARPHDHDAWVAADNPGWGYHDMLPYYKTMENCPFGDDKWHGRDGPYRISRFDWDELTPAARASADAMERLGYTRVKDANVPDEPGFSLAPLSAIHGVRQSTAITYLNPARKRPNLEVRGDTCVDSVLFEGTTATGVRLVTGEHIPARQVVLSSGTYGSPAILMRSGIGQPEQLAEHGINPVVDLPGVGANLVEHPVMWNIYAAHPPSTDAMPAWFQLALGVASNLAEPDYDLHVLPTAVVPTSALPEAFVPPVDNHPTGWDMVMFVSCVQPDSRGTVRLRSKDPNDPPVIDLGLYSELRDAERVGEAVRIARQIASTPPLRELIVDERMPGANLPDNRLADAVRGAPSHYNHASGTAKMGPASDPLAVVDSTLTVHGIDGLRVVDASILPTIPRVPVNPTVIVVAEKAAALIAQNLVPAR